MGMKVSKCDVCKCDLTGKPHVDGATQMGPWANMCTDCHNEVGCGLGTGRGQKYDGNDNKEGG